MFKIKKPPKNDGKMSIKEFYGKRNKVLLIRNARGIGDILNCRMLFKAFKDMMPEVYLVFACFKEYKSLVQDHPYIDEVVDVRTVVKEDYLISYDISTCCIYHESLKATKNETHRADIWAEHCGLTIEEHDMFLPYIDPEILSCGHIRIQQLKKTSLSSNRHGPTVLLCTKAHDVQRSLTQSQTVALVEILRRKGLFVYSTHISDLPLLESLGVPVLKDASLEEWMSYIHAADYVVTVDTGTFHYAGGIKKPLMGIFTHVDGKLRGKYYDFVLVQKHRDNGNWPCGPCYTFINCTNPRCKDPNSLHELKPCLTEITVEEMEKGVDKMLQVWPI
jgi:ADP-heptose:LPS heptosyltransferase